MILRDIQYISKQNKVSLPEKNTEVSTEKQRKLLKELNSPLIIFYLQAQKLTQVNSKKESPDVIISSQLCVCVCVCVKSRKFRLEREEEGRDLKCL